MSKNIENQTEKSEQRKWSCHFCKKLKDFYDEYPNVEITVSPGLKTDAHQSCINYENNGHKDYS